jgi:drug/metabolite transporter (DMT)-like permease
VALIAGYFVTFPGGVVNFGEGGGYVLAALYAFLAAVAWGSSTAFSRFTLLNHSDTYITGLRFLLTVPFAFVLLLSMGESASLSSITWMQVGILALIAFSTGMAALWIYYKGLKTTPASISAIVELAFPVTAVFLDWVLYDTALTLGQYVAVAVLLFSAYRVALLAQASLK